MVMHVQVVCYNMAELKVIPMMKVVGSLVPRPSLHSLHTSIIIILRMTFEFCYLGSKVMCNFMHVESGGRAEAM